MKLICKDDKIIFIGGVQRSGTTLLRNILNMHPSIKIGYENAFYKRLFDKYHAGLGLENISEFIADLKNTKRFERWSLNFHSLKKRLLEFDRALTYTEAIICVLNEFFSINYNNERFVGIKNPNAVLHINFIYSLFPNAKIIILVRDPRAILASEKTKRLRAGDYDSPELIWKTFRRFSILCRNLKQHKGSIKKTYFRELIKSPEKSTVDICDFLGVRWDKSLLDFYKGKHEPLLERDKEQHKLSVQKLDFSRIDAFREVLSNNEILLIEFLLKRQMKQHGFKSLKIRRSISFFYELALLLKYAVRQIIIKVF